MRITYQVDVNSSSTPFFHELGIDAENILRTIRDSSQELFVSTSESLDQGFAL